MGKKLDKFLLLMWKNWILQIRHPVQTILEIAAPVLFCALLVLIRSLVDPEEQNAVFYPTFEPKQGILNYYLRNITTILYSPINTNLAVIMDSMAEKLNLSAAARPNAETIELELQNELNLIYILGAVQFNDSLGYFDPLPKDLHAAIRLPGELRTLGMNSIVASSWRTNLLFPQIQFAGPRSPTENFTASPDYYSEGFLAVQAALSESILEYFGSSLPLLQMQRFPYPAWTDDPLLVALESFVGLMLLLSFNYSAINIIKSVTIEKERQIKEAMKIMGLPNWLHWIAWFLKAFVFLLISIILITILLTVAWYPGTSFSVFTLSDPLVIFLFLLLYICSVITFCFMISVFFSKANTAAAIGGAAFFLTYTPFLFLNNQYDDLSLSTKLFASLGSNTAMSLGFQLIIRHEGTGEGAQFNNIWRTTSPDDNLTLGAVMMMLILDAVIYMLIALYVEAVFPGDYGVPLPWYFPFTASFWCGQPKYVGIEDFSENINIDNQSIEKEPTNLRAGIKIRALRKTFGRKTAVRDISLNMYEDHITVLLGHNGAGKTTTMSMLTGVLTPTAGTAYVGGHNIRTEMWKVRDSLGLCPQHNILFDDLTVEEHIYFFSRLKGVKRRDANCEIQKYVQLLELVPKMKEKSKTLSGGMKRKLSVGIALCGNSKVVMLDEPTAGMDPSARRALWDLLQKQKKGRTMLLTTHFMDEADLLGDRIAIMAGGKVQCCGSSFFLKKKYGAGYHLIMDKSQSCVPSRVTELLRKHISEIEIESNIGSELTYVLSESHLPVFEEMLRDLEEHSEVLGVRSYGISLTTLEEVFMKVGADHGQEETNNALEDGVNPDILNDHSRHKGPDSTTKLQIGDSELLSGWRLRRNQALAMLLKKSVSIARSWILLLIQIFIPVIFLIITIVAERSVERNKDLPELELSLDSYDRPVTILGGSGPYKTGYLDILKNNSHLYEDIENGNITEYIVQKTIEATSTVRQRYILGTTFDSDSIMALFSSQPYHSPPLALSMAVNSVIQSTLNSSYNIEITNYPLPFTINSRFAQLSEYGNMGFSIAFNIVFAMAFVSSFYVLFYVRERVSNAKHLQFVSGVEVSTFWCISYICDLITFIITSIALIITLVAFQENGFKSVDDLGRIFLLLLLFGYSMLPLHFLASYLFSVPSTGYTRMSLFNIFTGVAAFLTVQILASDGLNLEYIADALDWVFLIFPHYCLCSGIRNNYAVFSTYDICSTLVQTCSETMDIQLQQCWDLACNYTSQCCNVEQQYFAWESPGIGRNIVYSLSIGTLLFILLLAIEYGIFQNIIYRINNRFAKPPYVSADEDPDVSEERRKIHNSTKVALDEYALLLQDVTKYYKNFLAVNGLCLGVKKYECFGLLGVNGAGKTTTFKMMTGDTKISYGEAWVNGISLKSDLKKVQKLIGYCPQFDAVLDDLTGYETLLMFCLLRGIDLTESKKVAEHLAREFDFDRHLHKRVKEYSGGNKRKLSTAIALIGDPPVLYLDEPTTGMDPATKRFLWNVLCKVRDSGKSIILTSHSMEECEALCTRLAIMVNGTFKCLGSTQRLKSKFSEGYTLTIKTRKATDNAILNAGVAAIENFVLRHFPSAVLREKHQEMLSYFIKDQSLPWSRMFGIMEEGKRQLNIEDYSLGQCSLEQVFLSFTKFQRPDTK